MTDNFVCFDLYLILKLAPLLSVSIYHDRCWFCSFIGTDKEIFNFVFYWCIYQILLYRKNLFCASHQVYCISVHASLLQLYDDINILLVSKFLKSLTSPIKYLILFFFILLLKEIILSFLIEEISVNTIFIIAHCSNDTAVYFRSFLTISDPIEPGHQLPKYFYF